MIEHMAKKGPPIRGGSHTYCGKVVRHRLQDGEMLANVWSDVSCPDCLSKKPVEALKLHVMLIIGTESEFIDCDLWVTAPTPDGHLGLKLARDADKAWWKDRQIDMRSWSVYGDGDKVVLKGQCPTTGKYVAAKITKRGES